LLQDIIKQQVSSQKITEPKQLFYLLGSTLGLPGRRHLYHLRLRGRKKR
jgi:hypothetical protein